MRNVYTHVQQTDLQRAGQLMGGNVSNQIFAIRIASIKSQQTLENQGFAGL